MHVRAITTVAGNVPVEQATRNALYVAELCGSNVPVYGGAARPIWREHAPADWFHGKDGLGDHLGDHGIRLRPVLPHQAMQWTRSDPVAM